MTPLEALHDHAQRPRHLGRMQDASAVGNVGSIVSGRALRWFLRHEQGQVQAASFQVFACPEQVAATSVLCELVQGKSLEACAHLGHADIAAALGGLPLAELPAQLWGQWALRDALAQCQVPAAGTRDLPAPDSPLLCRCHGVSEADLKALFDAGAQSLDALLAATSASRSCGTCRRDLAALVDAWRDQSDLPGSGTASVPRGRVGLLYAIQQALEPLLSGSDWEIWDMQGREVIIRHPADWNAEDCDRLHDRAERRLKDAVDPLLQLRLEARRK